MEPNGTKVYLVTLYHVYIEKRGTHIQRTLLRRSKHTPRFGHPKFPKPPEIRKLFNTTARDPPRCEISQGDTAATATRERSWETARFCTGAVPCKSARLPRVEDSCSWNRGRIQRRGERVGGRGSRAARQLKVTR